MPVTPDNLRDFAKKLACSGSDEAELRAAVSRAYYACYHALKPFAERLPPSENCRPNASHLEHKEMCARITQWKVDGLPGNLKQMTATKSQLSRAIDTARTLRSLADYRLGSTVTLTDAEQQVERARLILRHAILVDAELSRNDNAAQTA